MTAEEFLKFKKQQYAKGIGNSFKTPEILEQERLTEFAKLHVEAALKEASEKAEWKGYTLAAVEICDYSILDAYPLENIK